MLGQPMLIDPSGHANESREPRDGHARFGADHLEVPDGGEILRPLPPHPQLHMGLAQRRLQLLVLRFELDLARRPPLAARSQGLSARLEQQPLPVVHRLLADPSPATGLSSAQFPPPNTHSTT